MKELLKKIEQAIRALDIQSLIVLLPEIEKMKPAVDLVSGGLFEIAKERHHQVEDEGFKSEHDALHGDESMAIVASCYASPSPIFIHVGFIDEDKHVFHDPWPRTWARHWDKRGKHSRIKRLAIAGALCAAEIDRLKANETKEGDGS